MSSPPITPEMGAAHGLTPDEYQQILTLIGRVPSLTELGIFSAMWNEHCSYKSSRKWLKTLPTSGPCVVQGPGENAGVVDIGDNQVVVFKMESHNHPSYIEPYQGAATGVGGILRDIFTMGARPIATMNALRFGEETHPKTRYLVSGVVSGIGGYANAFGVPVTGGEVNFHKRYNGNCLVNAFAAGIADKDKIFYARADERVGVPLFYLGAKTGRDGVGGATMASSEFSNTEGAVDQKKPTVQVGDPFVGKCLSEACLELMAENAIIAIQDMGAAGLTCSAVEMGAKSGLGISLTLDHVPVRAETMTAYEMMLSESQERMLLLLSPEKEECAQKIAHKWGLSLVQIGQTTATSRFVVHHQGKCVVDLPIQELADAAPLYDRPWVMPPVPEDKGWADFPLPDDYSATLLALIGGAEGSSRRWVYEQYDTLVQGNGVLTPGQADAGVVRIEGTRKALAFSVDVTPRYCQADPYQGSLQAVAECWRNLTAVGATPLAITDNLNFGNPEKEDAMGMFVRSVEGIGAACRALSFPVVSGNVSLYNETDGVSIMPTPAIAGVGLISDDRNCVGLAFDREDDFVFLVGAPARHLGQTWYAQYCGHVSDEGDKSQAPPRVDLETELRHGHLIRSLIQKKLLTACHDISDGGLAVALAEMALAGGVGAEIRIGTPELDPMRCGHVLLFGEDQSRYVVTCRPEGVSFLEKSAQVAEVPLQLLGRVKGICLSVEPFFSVTLEQMAQAHEMWFPRFMQG